MKRNNSDLLKKLQSSVKEAFDNAIKQESLQTFEKSEFDVVTSLDYSMEKALMKIIREMEPDAVFLSEEFNPETSIEGRIWIIDPIDGTCNFSNGIDIYGVQCALYDNGEPQLSVIYLPGKNECFTALRNEGAWLNGAKISRNPRPVEKSIISFGDFNHTDPALMELEHEVMRHVAPKVERIRMVGAASVDFAYSALGRFDGNITFTKNPWDIMPGILLCQESGMIITDVYGDRYTGKNSTVAVFSSEELMRACVLDRNK